MTSIFNNVRSTILIISTILLIFSACKKEDFDESDLTVYKWEVIHYYKTFGNNISPAAKDSYSERRIEINRELLALTNKQVNEMKRDYKDRRDVEIQIRRL